MHGSFFDTYTLKARFLPSLLLGLPFLITFFCWFPEIFPPDIIAVISFLLLSLSFPLSHIVRSKGKRIESILFEKWGGVPSTQLLRHSNKFLGEKEKKRYKDILGNLVSNISFPPKSVESKRPDYADDQYSSAIKWLISNTRDIKSFPLVFAENVNYGFRRNMYAIKYLAINILSVSITINVVFLFWSWQSKILDIPLLGVISFALILVMAITWIFFVKSNWVKETAFEYAKQLLQTCDTFQVGN